MLLLVLLKIIKDFYFFFNYRLKRMNLIIGNLVLYNMLFTNKNRG